MTDSPVGLHEFNRVVRITLLVPVTVLALLAGSAGLAGRAGPGSASAFHRRLSL